MGNRPAHRRGRTRLVVALIAATVTALLAAAPASAAGEPSLYPLPKETKGYGLTAGPDGAMWFIGHHGPEYKGGEGDYIGRVAGAWEVTEFPLPKGVTGGSPVAGPEGALWFPTHTDGKKRNHFGITRITTTGQMHEFVLGHAQGGIGGIAAVGNELLVSAAHYYGRRQLKNRTLERFTVAPTGLVLTQRKVLARECRAVALVGGAGPFWFAEQCGTGNPKRPYRFGRLVRLEAGLETASYLLPANSSVWALSRDQEGGIWFSDLGANGRQIEFGRIAPSGAIARWPVPKARPAPIAAGPEGRLYFALEAADGATRELDSIGPAGDLGTLFCAGPNCDYTPIGLTTGPEGALWYSAGHAYVPYGGGGGGGLMQEEAIARESGFLVRLPL